MVSSPKSITKSTKDDHHLEETPKTNSKRKRTPGKENVCIFGSQGCIYFISYGFSFKMKFLTGAIYCAYHINVGYPP